MLSGIGPADHLRSRRHRAGGRSAGRQEPAGPSRRADHVRAHRGQRIPRATCGSTRWRSTCCAPICSAPGPATVVPGGLHAFIKTRPELAVPDIEFMFRGAPPERGAVVPGLEEAPTPTATASGRACCIPTAAARCCCARPIRATRCGSSRTSSRRRTTCRPCAQGFKIAREVAAQAPLEALPRRRD